MADRQFVAPFGTHAAPADWRLPGSLEIVPKIAWASFDGAAAAGSYKPCLRVISDSGHVACEAVSDVVVAAGASADVTWFPGVDEDAEQAAGETVGVTSEVSYYDTPNAGTPLTMSTTLASGVPYVLIIEGTYSLWNTALPEGVPEANAQFPGSVVGRVSTQVGLDAETCFARQSGSAVPLSHSALLTLSLDGGATFTHVEPVGGPYTTPLTGHLYRYELTGQGFPLRIKLNDVNPPDNYGKFRITLQVPSGTGTGSGAGSLVPPADTTLNGDVLTVVTGVPAWAASVAGTVTSVASPGATIGVTNPAGPVVDLDLPASGVAAATYGDSTHVGRFTVDAKGRLTAAAAIAISGIAGAGFTTLFDQTLGADAATIDTGANGIAQTSQHLLIMWIARSDEAVVFSSARLTNNGDTGANYDRTTLRVTGTTVTGAQGNATAGWDVAAMGSTAAANEYGVGILFIPAYTQTTARKTAYACTAMIDPTLANNRVEASGVGWRSTAAINQMTLTKPGGGTVLKAGSRLTIYGMG